MSGHYYTWLILKEVDTMKIELGTTVKQSTNQVSCDLNDEVAILNLESNLYFGMDEVGAYIWQAMREPTKVSDLCDRVHERYEVGAEECQADVLEFIQKLDDAKLLAVDDAGSTGGS
jgi:hypothetical protein